MLSTITVFHFLDPVWCLSICSWTGIIGAYKWVMDRDLLWSSITFSRQSQSFPFSCPLSLFCLSLRSESFLPIFSFSSLGTVKISPGTHEPLFCCFPHWYSPMFSRVLAGIPILYRVPAGYSSCVFPLVLTISRFLTLCRVPCGYSSVFSPSTNDFSLISVLYLHRRH